MIKPVTSILAAALLSLSATISAAVTLPSVLSDGVVLQREQPIKIWGKALPGEQVTVKLKSSKAKTVADDSGKWSVTLSPLKAGGPYVLTVNDISVNDVLIGDIYLCSGQSNMELMVSRVMDFYADEVESYTNPAIREFKTPKEYAFHGAKDDVSKSEWKKVEPGKVKNFGALVYFIAKNLYENNGHVPVGIVNSSWGGSRIETWISENSMAKYPLRLNRLHTVEDDEYRSLLSKAENRASYLWSKTMNKSDLGYNSGVRWSDPSADDSSWTEYDLLSLDWGKADGQPVNGSHWLRKDFEVPAAKAGHDAELRLGCIVDADSVWVNGTFVGFTSYQYPPRIYKIPAGVLHEGKNNITVRVVSNSGTPHFVPEKPHKVIFGENDEISLEGKWRHHLGTPMPKAPSVTDFFQTPTVLYNGLISPFVNMSFRGVVWYQGESDVDIRSQYKDLMKTLIADWRESFANPTLPFFIVELADFLHPSDQGGRRAWQEMRDAQRMAAEETTDAYWIKNGDVGEWNDIHPRDKKTPGTRTATAILKHYAK